MFKFWYENFLMRFSYVIAFAAFIGVFVYAYILEVERDEMQEKQSFQQAVIADLGRDGLQNIALNKPHRADKELKGWISGVVSEALSIDVRQFDKMKKNLDGYFTPSGMAQYQAYLESAGILQNLRDSNNRMRIFVEEQPLLLNGSDVNGIYRWLYQLPVTLSFQNNNSNDYNNNSVNRKIMLRLQLRRVPASEHVAEMKIESWTVTGRR
jgi:hypothetical protein